jgi:hypothetical protein
MQIYLTYVLKRQILANMALQTFNFFLLNVPGLEDLIVIYSN